MKKFTASLLVFSLLFVSIPQKSHALVGIAIKNSKTRTIGEIVTAVSGVSFIGSFLAIGTESAIAGYIFISSMPGMALGLVILDEKEADVKFKPLSNDKANLLGLNEDELEVYNSEVDELNAVTEEIEAQVSEKVSNEEIAQLWSEYGRSLSPETMNVAAKVILKTFEAKKK